jgi:hypothetical protein
LVPTSLPAVSVDFPCFDGVLRFAHLSDLLHQRRVVKRRVTPSSSLDLESPNVDAERSEVIEDAVEL